MAKYLLTVDVGNTQTAIGLYAGEALEHKWRIATCKQSTADEVRTQLAMLLLSEHIEPSEVIGVSLASVVPWLTESWCKAVARLFGCDAVLCNAQTAGALFETDYPNPNEIGADRVADAVAMRAIYGAPSVLVDFGTATNIEILDADGRFVGGVIAPGVETSMQALFSNASKLAMVDLDDPGSVIGRSTTQAIQAGVVYGEACRVDGLVERIFEELGYGAPVVATGGLAPTVAQHARRITDIDADLTLKGLRLVWLVNEAHKD